MHVDIGIDDKDVLMNVLNYTFERIRDERQRWVIVVYKRMM